MRACRSSATKFSSNLPAHCSVGGSDTGRGARSFHCICSPVRWRFVQPLTIQQRMRNNPALPRGASRFLGRLSRTNEASITSLPDCVKDYPEESTTSEKIAGDFDILRRSGTKLLRVGIGWDGVEERPGEYNWRCWDEIIDTAQRDGVTLLPYVCYTPQWAGGSSSDFWREPPRDLAGIRPLHVRDRHKIPRKSRLVGALE